LCFRENIYCNLLVIYIYCNLLREFYYVGGMYKEVGVYEIIILFIVLSKSVDQNKLF